VSSRGCDFTDFCPLV